MSTIEDEDLYRQCLIYNRKLECLVKKMQIFFEGTQTNILFGVEREDPLSESFRREIDRIEKTTKMLTANTSKLAQESPNSSNIVYQVCRFFGYSAGGTTTNLRSELDAKIQLFTTAQESFQRMVRTTESSQKFSEISDSLPKDQKLLMTLDDGSVRDILENAIESSNEVKAVYMKDTLQSNVGTIDKDTLQRSFEAMDREVEYISQLPMVEYDTRLTEIIQCTLKMARFFAIILKKCYNGDLGEDYAQFSNDRFKAAYLLIQKLSSLMQGITKLHKPITQLLSFPSRTLPGTQNSISTILGICQTSTYSTRHDLNVFRSLCEKLEVFVQHCQKFAEKNREMMQNAFPDGKDLCQCGLEDQESESDILIRELDRLTFDRRLDALDEDGIDPDYFPHSHVSVSNEGAMLASSTKMDDVISELERLGLFEMTSTHRKTECASGSFGTVFHVPFQHNELLVAVKQFAKNPVEDVTKTYKRIVREAIIMSDLDHKNILRVYGYGNIPSSSISLTDVSLVSAFYPNGCLDLYLSKHRPVSELEKCKILLDIASALEYLHDPKKNCGVIIHGDLRSPNILIGPDKRAILCDFGMAVKSSIDERWKTESNRTNDAWLAYEFFDMGKDSRKARIPLTVKTDVYAFGCVSFEVYLERQPYEGDCSYLHIPILKNRKQPPNVGRFPKEYRLEQRHRRVMDRCWHEEPRRRPSASQLVQFFEAFVSLLSTTQP
ncbi:kinase-like protein [Schizopora paradoxa]|uniref:Kinase-like protein n=1 Tax=Schizopora paradoxa TaxID=27342 RepID=A0A0H2RV08_9AGAM|nr:kinase-like protein [Schizopora paradoxa]